MLTLRLLSEGVTQHIEGQTTEVRKCGSFLKDSVVYPWYDLLSNAGRLWPVFLPLSAHKLHDERDCRGKSEVSESYLAAIRKDRLGDTSLPLSTMVSVPRRGFEGEKNRKKVYD